jgi:hypothetical protein
MLTCMDDLTAPLVADPEASSGGGGGGCEGVGGGGHPARVAARPHVVVIGATNRPDALDPALRWGRGAAGHGGRGRRWLGVGPARPQRRPRSSARGQARAGLAQHGARVLGLRAREHIGLCVASGGAR